MALKANIAANYAGQGWRMLMALAFVPVYIKYLGIEAYGLIGLFASLQAWIGLLDFGLRPALGREMARYSAGAMSVTQARTLLRSVEWIGVALALVIVIAFWLGSSLFATGWIRETTLTAQTLARACAIMGVVIGLLFIESIYSSCLIALQRQVLQNAVTSIMATVRSVGAIAVLAFWSPTIEAFMAWQAIVGVVTLLALSVAVYGVLPRADGPVSFSVAELRKIWRFAAGAMAISLLGLLLMHVDRLLLSRLLTLEAFGYYALAVAIASTLYVGCGPIAQAFYPRFTQLVATGDERALALAYHRAAQLVAIVIAPAAAILIVFGCELLEIWTGNAELAAQAAPIMALLAAGYFCNSLMWIPYFLQLSAGWTKLAVYTNIPAVLILVPALLIFTPKYGAIAGGWCWFLLNLTYLVVQPQLMHRRLLKREKWSWYLNDVALPVAAVAIVVILFRLAAPADAGRLEGALFLGLCGAAMFAAALASAPALRGEVMRRFAGRHTSRFAG